MTGSTYSGFQLMSSPRSCSTAALSTLSVRQFLHVSVAKRRCRYVSMGSDGWEKQCDYWAMLM